MNRLAMTVASAAGCCVALASDGIPPPRPVDVAALVRQLGGGEFADREAAVRRLSTLKVDAVPPELLAALRSDDPEVRDRAAKAARALRERIARERERADVARLPRAERFARRGQIDLFVASTAAGGAGAKDDDDRLWVPAFEVGVRAVQKAELTGDRRPHGGPTWFKDFATYRSKYPGMRFFRTDGVHPPPGKESWIYHDAIRAAGVADPGSLYGLVVSRGPVGARGMISQSLILATGDVTSGDDIRGSVVICDGDVRVGRNLETCLIIARGKITVGGHTAANTLVAVQTVTGAEHREAGDLRFGIVTKQVVEERVRKPLGFVTFFELSTVGVEVKVADGAVRVSAVADGGAFAAAGVRVGDVVTAVNGKKPDTAESLRRLLRDALAVGDATVTLKRGDKTETATVSLPE